MADKKLLETFPNPAPRRDYVIEHTHHEFTSLCPMTGHPDFADITVREYDLLDTPTAITAPILQCAATDLPA